MAHVPEAGFGTASEVLKTVFFQEAGFREYSSIVDNSSKVVIIRQISSIAFPYDLCHHSYGYTIGETWAIKPM
jgi:hypothetical protein